ncbi:MAG: serine/threonine protein phosphatase [Spirochaetaceae bacterium]|nr:MAG: serine/threonine protein phosphatase [Spirochaetaceae bacterium]
MGEEHGPPRHDRVVPGSSMPKRCSVLLGNGGRFAGQGAAHDFRFVVPMRDACDIIAFVQKRPNGYIAIGDIHGCLHQLNQVIELCAEYRDHALVFLGDYIDGGPDSDAVLTRVRSLPAVHLIGNHEISLIRVRTGESGKTVPAHLTRLPDVSDTNFEWMQTQLRFMLETPDYIFVHAGLDPHRALAEQTEADLLWSRYDGEYAEYSPRLVVHGHTRVDSVQRTGNRVNINTSAGYGGPITALVLPEWRVLQSEATQGRSNADELQRMRLELEELRREHAPAEDPKDHGIGGRDGARL